MPATRLLVVRHAQSTWNAAGLWQGWADPPLSALGEEQARLAGAQARSLSFDAVASSDLRRARRSAELAAAAAGWPTPGLAHPGLREYDLGAWSGLNRDEIEQLWPGQIRLWREGALPAPPGGETRSAFEARVVAALGDVCADHPGCRVLLVAHGGVVRAVGRVAAHQPVAPMAGYRLDVGVGEPVPLGAAREPVDLLGAAAIA
jgi:probable phosphoglycerate mutase